MSAVPDVVAAPVVVEEANRTHMSWGFAELFLISQTALPALLYLPGTQPFRLPIRVSAFAISLAAFAWWQIDSTIHISAPKVQSWAAAIIALLTLMLFHPSTPNILGGLAHIGVYVAVIAPLFWAPVFVRTPERLARLFWILLLCSGANSVIGVLQVYNPSRWLPAEFSTIVTSGVMGLGPVSFHGPNGQLIVRPPGLFDTPGAVAGPGMSAALLGLVFATSAMVPAWKRVLSLTLSGAGLAAIYLSQVRISLVIAVLMVIVYVMTTFRQGRYARGTQLAILGGAMVFVSFLLALALGGTAIQDRVMTLLTGDPISVYKSARGVQLNLTFSELLFDHPFGSGLARWGMAAGYFGTFDPLRPPLWAEIQFTGWMIDGGILLIALYCGAIVLTALSEWQVAIHSRVPRLATCAAVTLAANLGVAALIFSFTPFVTQIGIQYWFLAGALHGVATRYGDSAA